MSDLHAICDECQGLWPIDRFLVGGAVCFKCRVSTVQFAKGHLRPQGLYKDVPDMTIKQGADRMVEDFERVNGYKPEPAGARWV